MLFESTKVKLNVVPLEDRAVPASGMGLFHGGLVGGLSLDLNVGASADVGGSVSAVTHTTGDVTSNGVEAHGIGNGAAEASGGLDAMAKLMADLTGSVDVNVDASKDGVNGDVNADAGLKAALDAAVDAWAKVNAMLSSYVDAKADSSADSKGDFGADLDADAKFRGEFSATY